MSDVRALLKAKRQEVRINHPLASYTSTGQLRCVACSTTVKHASAWEGHIGSKAHRTNAARLREEQARKAQQEEEERENLKRKAMEVDDEDEDEDVPMVDAKKRRVDSEEVATASNRKTAARNALPEGFFSDPSMAPPPPEDNDEDGDEEAEVAGTDAATAVTPGATQDALDLEWQQFQQSVVNAPDYHETYERATVFAEPALAAEVPQGFPSAGPADGEGEEGEGAPEKREEMDAEALRRKKELEERELIMDRLLEEEQAQEEADARVTVLKNKLEALRKKREAAKAARKGAKSS